MQIHKECLFFIPVKLVLAGMRDVALFHYPSRTDSIKPSLQFACYFADLYASEGSLFSRYLHFQDTFSKIFILKKDIWTVKEMYE
jgi:hypothetical protein